MPGGPEKVTSFSLHIVFIAEIYWMPPFPIPLNPEQVSMPWPGTRGEIGQDAFGDLDIVGDFEVEHAGKAEIRALAEDVAEGIFRRNGPGGHDFERDPRLGRGFHELDRLARVLAPH